jgi:hypothetical protein
MFNLANYLLYPSAGPMYFYDFYIPDAVYSGVAVESKQYS